MKNNKVLLLTRILAILSSGALIASLFVPLWRIELDAPQYPEGLALQIYPYKLGGDVEIINGLNHYIGMQTLHAENFVEFALLPYIIGVFAILFLSVALVDKRRWLYIVFYAFVAFGIVAMADFWRWEYNYGHELDPNAAIKVPGMAYQPPLIGFKQLLNFGAYSIPDTGGLLFILAGLALLVAVMAEAGWLKRFNIGKKAIVVLSFAGVLSACGQSGPEPIVVNTDKCAYCKMTISDARFATELKTEKGRVYKFDDVSCMISFIAENKATPAKYLWVSRYNGAHDLIDATQAVFVKWDGLRSPMRGNVAAFGDEKSAAVLLKNSGAIKMTWNELTAKP
jgi:copper chaperone NosL